MIGTSSMAFKSYTQWVMMEGLSLYCSLDTGGRFSRNLRKLVSLHFLRIFNINKNYKHLMCDFIRILCVNLSEFNV